LPSYETYCSSNGKIEKWQKEIRCGRFATSLEVHNQNKSIKVPSEVHNQDNSIKVPLEGSEGLRTT
jgi:hypothetical protein